MPADYVYTTTERLPINVAQLDRDFRRIGYTIDTIQWRIGATTCTIYYHDTE